MANAKISQITNGALTTPATTLLFEIENAAGDSYYITLANMLKVIDSLTAKATPVGADKIPIYNVAGSAAGYMTITALQTILSLTASQISDFDTEVANNSAVSANTAKVTNATHTGDVTGATELTIADNVVDEANLKLEEGPTNDYVLTADDTKSGGMKWAAASGGFSDPMTTRGDIIIKNASNETTRLGVGTAGQLLGTDGTDVLYISKKLDDLAAPDDNTDLNASTSAHGLLPKLSNTATEFLNGQGSWATPTGNGLATQLTIDSTPDSDSTANGIKLSMTAGESVVYGDLLYQNSDGEVYKADADAAATMPALYMALESKGNGEAVSVLKSGIARLDSWAWTVGARLFASTTPGAITATAPSGSGDQVQVIGYATHADRIDFNPSRDVLELS